MAGARNSRNRQVVDQLVQPVEVGGGQGNVVHRPDHQRRDGLARQGKALPVFGQRKRRVHLEHLYRAGAVPVQHGDGGFTVLPVGQQRGAFFGLHLRVFGQLTECFEQHAAQPEPLDQCIAGGIAKDPEVLARRALDRVGVEQLGKQHRMRRIGDHRAGHPPAHLPHNRHPPGQRAAPIVADDRELFDPQRIGQQEHVADQFVGGIILDPERLGRAAIAALVGGDAAEPARQVRDLVAPGAVAIGEAVQEDQRGGIAQIYRLWPGVHHIEFDPVRQRDPLLLHHSAPSFMRLT